MTHVSPSELKIPFPRKESKAIWKVGPFWNEWKLVARMVLTFSYKNQSTKQDRSTKG